MSVQIPGSNVDHDIAVFDNNGTLVQIQEAYVCLDGSTWTKFYQRGGALLIMTLIADTGLGDFWAITGTFTENSGSQMDGVFFMVDGYVGSDPMTVGVSGGVFNGNVYTGLTKQDFVNMEVGCMSFYTDNGVLWLFPGDFTVESGTTTRVITGARLPANVITDRINTSPILPVGGSKNVLSNVIRGYGPRAILWKTTGSNWSTVAAVSDRISNMFNAVAVVALSRTNPTASQIGIVSVNFYKIAAPQVLDDGYSNFTGSSILPAIDTGWSTGGVTLQGLRDKGVVGITVINGRNRAQQVTMPLHWFQEISIVAGNKLQLYANRKLDSTQMACFDADSTFTATSSNSYIDSCDVGLVFNKLPFTVGSFIRMDGAYGDFIINTIISDTNSDLFGVGITITGFASGQYVLYVNGFDYYGNNVYKGLTKAEFFGSYSTVTFTDTTRNISFVITKSATNEISQTVSGVTSYWLNSGADSPSVAAAIAAFIVGTSIGDLNNGVTIAFS